MGENPASGAPYVSTRKKVNNKENRNDAILMILFSVIGLSLLSLYVSVIIVNAQAYSYDSIPSSSNTNSEPHVAQMGICEVGAGGPCNGGSNNLVK